MNIAHLLVDTVTYQTPTGLTATGNPTWSSQSTTEARVEYGTQHVIGPNGMNKTCEAVIVTLVEIPVTARVWFPGTSTADVNASKRPITTKKASTLDGSYTIFEAYF